MSGPFGSGETAIANIAPDNSADRKLAGAQHGIAWRGVFGGDSARLRQSDPAIRGSEVSEPCDREDQGTRELIRGTRGDTSGPQPHSYGRSDLP
jgi:hypothetical protein